MLYAVLSNHGFVRQTSAAFILHFVGMHYAWDDDTY